MAFKLSTVVQGRSTQCMAKTLSVYSKIDLRAIITLLKSSSGQGSPLYMTSGDISSTRMRAMSATASAFRGRLRSPPELQHDLTASTSSWQLLETWAAGGMWYDTILRAIENLYNRHHRILFYFNLISEMMDIFCS